MLGWPKGQQTISENDLEARPGGAAPDAQWVTEKSPDDVVAAKDSGQPDLPDVPGSETAAAVPDAPTAPSPPQRLGN